MSEDLVLINKNELNKLKTTEEKIKEEDVTVFTHDKYKELTEKVKQLKELQKEVQKERKKEYNRLYMKEQYKNNREVLKKRVTDITQRNLKAYNLLKELYTNNFNVTEEHINIIKEIYKLE
uniref:Uncharacterized protein n=1 Tax=viral metagenome TaxID=1070528 RepID=A0A6C0HD28_9ZZZZ